MQHTSWVALNPEEPVWNRFFTVAPLVLVGTVEPDGTYDLAPKHMVTPLGWDNYIGFVCTPHHATYQNARRTKSFTINYLRPENILEGSLTAMPHEADAHKPAVDILPLRPAAHVEGPLLEDAYACLECELLQIVDGFGENSLIAGSIVAAYVHEDSLRSYDKDDADMICQYPLLAYLHPGRFAVIKKTYAFPFPATFRR